MYWLHHLTRWNCSSPRMFAQHPVVITGCWMIPWEALSWERWHWFSVTSLSFYSGSCCCQTFAEHCSDFSSRCWKAWARAFCIYKMWSWMNIVTCFADNIVAQRDHVLLLDSRTAAEDRLSCKFTGDGILFKNYFFILAVAWGIQNLSSLTRDWTHDPCDGRALS